MRTGLHSADLGEAELRAAGALAVLAAAGMRRPDPPHRCPLGQRQRPWTGVVGEWKTTTMASPERQVRAIRRAFGEPRGAAARALVSAYENVGSDGR